MPMLVGFTSVVSPGTIQNYFMERRDAETGRLQTPNGRNQPMRNQLNTLIAVSGLALTMCTATTLAQVAPPPTKPAEQPQTAPTAEPKPAAPVAAQRPTPQDSKGATVGKLPTNIPYPPLANKGSDGKIIRLKELPDILALRANPTVGPASVEEIMPVLYGRRARFEMLTVNSLDLYWELTSGAIDNLSMGNLKELTRIGEMVKPLVGKTTLSEELTNRGILTRVQGGMNKHIVQEYKKAVGDEIQVLEGDNSLDSFMKFVLNDSIQESKLAYQALLAELIPQVDAVAAKAGVNSSAVNALRGAQAPITGEPLQIEAQINAFDKLFRQLSVNEGIALLSAMREMRENPNVSPFIKPIDVMHPRKTIMEANKMGVIVETGEEMDAKEAEKRKLRQEIKAERAAAEQAAKEAEEKAKNEAGNKDEPATEKPESEG